MILCRKSAVILWWTCLHDRRSYDALLVEIAASCIRGEVPKPMQLRHDYELLSTCPGDVLNLSHEFYCKKHVYRLLASSVS